jgi:serine O-acetyltransferase
MKLFDDLDVYAFRKGWPRWASFFVPFFYPNSWPIIAYRFGSRVVKLRNPLLKIPLYLIYFPIKRITEILTTIEISEYAEIDKGFFIAHIGSVVVGHHTKIGRYASMHQGVTIGAIGSGGGVP